MLTAAEIAFILSLEPFDRFGLVTRLLSRDDKYVYLEQCFARDCWVSNADLVKLACHEGGPPPMPESLQCWADFTASKRAEKNIQ